MWTQLENFVRVVGSVNILYCFNSAWQDLLFLVQVWELFKIILDYLMNKFIPAADPAMKSHHDTDIFWILYILVTKMSRMSNQASSM
jgi:hypothetical protein